jgi:hypothetical protein
LDLCSIGYWSVAGTLDHGSDISDSTKAGISLFQERLLHEAAQLSSTLTETVKKVRFLYRPRDCLARNDFGIPVLFTMEWLQLIIYYPSTCAKWKNV